MPRTTMTPYGEKGTPHMKGTKWLCPLAELKHPLLRSSHLHRIYETLPCPQTDRFISLSPPPVFHHDLNLWSWKQKKRKKRKGKCEEVRCDNKGGERKRESWKDSKVKKKKTNECIDISLSLYIYIYIILPVCFLFLFFLLWWREKRREEERDFPKWNWDVFSVVENDNGRINYQLFVLLLCFLLLLMLCHVCAVWLMPRAKGPIEFEGDYDCDCDLTVWCRKNRVTV
jgi:hypothetical protein